MKNSGIKVAVVGATGLVGRTMIGVLDDRDVAVDQLIPVASAGSQGVSLSFSNRNWPVSTLEEERWREAQVALFSAGSDISRKWIPIFTDFGITCIDNSSAFRQQESVPLVVPEVNESAVQKSDRILSNPNCSTIQLALVLAPLHSAFGLTEITVATYQSASGAGQTGKNTLLDEMNGIEPDESPFPHTLAQNLIPAIGELGDNGYFQEEWKLVRELRKILNLQDLEVYPTAVRVPTAHCHGEAVHAKFHSAITPEKARNILSNSVGIVLQDVPQDDLYPLAIQCAGKDEVFVGRIRQMPGQLKTLDLWIVTDNLRKGAATNAIQILQLLLKNELIDII